MMLPLKEKINYNKSKNPQNNNEYNNYDANKTKLHDNSFKK